jgi:hypothetical protein
VRGSFETKKNLVVTTKEQVETQVDKPVTQKIETSQINQVTLNSSESNYLLSPLLQTPVSPL